MTVLRCTAKLLKAMKAKPVADPSPVTNRLGEWTANLIRVGRIQLVLAVSEPTRFAVVIDAAPYATVPFRLSQNLFKALLFIGVPPDLAAAEAHAMEMPQIAASNSRSVLGTLNQFAFEVECDVDYGKARSAFELTQRLANTDRVQPETHRQSRGLRARALRFTEASSTLASGSGVGGFAAALTSLYGRNAPPAMHLSHSQRRALLRTRGF